MRQRQRTQETRGSRALVAWLIGAGVAVTTAAVLMIALPRESSVTDPGAVSSPRPVAVARAARRESRPTLDPARFSGKAAAAYQVAREIPEVLDQLQCYCACGSEYGHMSLLSCYTDGHGAT